MDAMSKACPTCGVDLTIFDVDKNGEINFDDVKIEDTESLDEILAEITKSDDIPKDIVEDLKSIGDDTTISESKEEAQPVPKESVETAETTVEAEKPEVEAKPEAVAEGEKPEAETKDIPPPPPAEGEGGETFKCPSCGTPLDASSDVCYNCGVEFVEEQATQFECPECGATVGIDESSCSNCGTQFEVEAVEEMPEEAQTVQASESAVEEIKEVKAKPEKEPEEEGDPYQRLQEIVEEVKPLLLIAKRYDINVSEGKELINKAIVAGKNRDAIAALGYVTQSKENVEAQLKNQILERIKKLRTETAGAQKTGIKVDVGKMLDEASTALAAKDYENAIQTYFKASEEFEMSSGEYIKANDVLKLMNVVAENSLHLQLDVSEVGRQIDRLKDEINKKNWKKAEKLAAEGTEIVKNTLTPLLQEEIKKARALLIEWKSKNKDITKPISILKEANIAAKNEEYGEALKQLVSFKKETKSL
jgi:predicted RNA-binding Zn-ribbon protein involved in translation (DUF1610 family)